MTPHTPGTMLPTHPSRPRTAASSKASTLPPTAAPCPALASSALPGIALTGIPLPAIACAALAAVVAALAPAVAFAQAAPTSPTATSPSANAPAASTAPSTEVVQLSPFEVASNADKGYTALNSNSITQFKTELGKLPVSADIFDEKFMADVGATSAEALIEGYSAGAGVANSNPGSSASNSQSLDRNGNSFVSLRGVTAPTMLRDGLMPLNSLFNSGSTSTNFTTIFDTESAEIINGPQALLYGVGGAGGVINLVSKQARIGQPAFGNYLFQVDQFGHEVNQLDYGMGTDKFAVRIAGTHQEIGARRVDVGGPLDGDYVQLAYRLTLGKISTDFRLTAEQTNYSKQGSGSPSFTAVNATNDVRNGQSLRYLLLTNQLQAAANGGASGAGYIGNGTINWNNVDSYGGWWLGEFSTDTFETMTADTRWNSWLSTEVSGGYRAYADNVAGSTPAIDAASVAANPTGVLAASTTNPGMLYEPLREKFVRVSGVAVNELFGGKALSQTVFGADFTRVDGDVITYQYEQADANFNPVVGTATSNNGYTAIPAIYWPVAGGPIREPYWSPLAKRVTYNGVNYVLMIPNDTVSSLISPSNPLGLTGKGSGDYRIGKSINSGVYGANYTNWLDGRLTSLLGFRLGRTDELNQLEQSSPQPPSGDLAADAHTTSFNAGLNYGLTSWLRPYVTVSNSFDAPAVLSADPLGNAPKVAHAIGEEAGFKITPNNAKISGSVLFFHADSKNEQYSFTSTLTNDINPSGLNGRYGAVSNFVNLDRTTQGLQATITASPNDNWNMRLSAATINGTIHSAATYPQYYNDQFYENSSGQVTYQDGTVVYVSSTATKATISTAGAVGAVPLTVTLMNTSTSPYYANPAAITAAINSSSGAATILKTVDPVHGAILTGVTGLPISQLQIAPLASSPPPGNIVLAEPGDHTTQYPQLSFNYTATYTILSGPLKGLTLGGTVTSYWKYAAYYYFPNGTAQPNSARNLFYQPDETLFNGIFAYARKFRRVTFTTRLNIANMFNHYHAFAEPNAVAGWSGPNSATFDQQPRVWTWSNQLSF